MTCFSSSETTKRLLLEFIRENADYSKRCSYLQEIVQMGKKDDVWRRALIAYFDTSLTGRLAGRVFSRN
jgi:hypothetical protein